MRTTMKQMFRMGMWNVVFLDLLGQLDLKVTREAIEETVSIPPVFRYAMYRDQSMGLSEMGPLPSRICVVQNSGISFISESFHAMARLWELKEPSRRAASHTSFNEVGSSSRAEYESALQIRRKSLFRRSESWRSRKSEIFPDRIRHVINTCPRSANALHVVSRKFAWNQKSARVSKFLWIWIEIEFEQRRLDVLGASVIAGGSCPLVCNSVTRGEFPGPGLECCFSSLVTNFECYDSETEENQEVEFDSSPIGRSITVISLVEMAQRPGTTYS
ncbi:hypothetical protein Tco_0909992 [Tanacetum coccineum]|uniref:Uncharacterized protein n=1 Tax=Tanacetum coccineum TaxID=301880 RepID=A0ABQ5CUE0_9ASTR